MKRLVLIVCLSVLAPGQQVLPQAVTPRDQLGVTADAMAVAGRFQHLSGNVVIETETMVLRADEVDFNSETGEITVHGDSRGTLKPSGK